MEKITKDRELTKKEKSIKELIKNNEQYLRIFNLLSVYFYLDYILNKSSYFSVFKAIYIDNVKLRNWEFANYCNICKTTLFEYRNKIIDFFYYMLNNDINIDKLLNKLI